ncbi:MAG: general secretion pathway protein GspL [Burkholderiales bacterium]|nr:general secretion pathway protein GspL [Burkholderiales bacterium]
MASTLYISLPSRATAQTQPDWAEQTLPFALISAEGRLQQQGQQTLAELKNLATGARQLSLLLAASDVSLLTVKVPPMSAAKFKSALPNLLEEQIMGDPGDAIMVATPVAEGLSTAAVADKAWLETLAMLVKDWPLHKIAAYPGQLALAPAEEAGAAVACIEEKPDSLELVLRHAAANGLGLTLAKDERAQALQMLVMLAPQAPITVYVPAAELETYQRLAQDMANAGQLSLQAGSWQQRTAGLQLHTPDLMSGIAAMHKPTFDWNLWRWPLSLAIAAVLVNVGGLNFEWFTMKREANSLSEAVMQTYRNSFPKETVILDPLVQMLQKVSASKRLAGQSASDDFVVLAAQFAQVWERVMAGKPATIASLEYKERALLVKLKSSEIIPLEQLRAALAEQTLELATSADGVLRIKVGGKR